MVRILGNGYEMNSAATGVEATTQGSPTIDSTTMPVPAGGGPRSLRISSMTSGAAQGQYIAVGVDVTGPYFFRHNMWFTTFPTADNSIIVLLDSTTVKSASITIGAAGALKLKNGATQVGSTFTLSLLTKYRIELKFNATPAAGSQELQLLVDGTIVAGSATLTLNANAGFAYWLWGGNTLLEAQTTGDWLHDDLAWNDSTGASQTTYPGDGNIVALPPIAPGDNADFARAGADSGANWSQVNEIPPNDATNYVSSNTLNNTDDYIIKAPTFSIRNMVNVVQVNIRNAGAGAVSNATLVPRLKALAGGTTTEGVAFTPPSATWVSQVGAILSLTQPGGSVPWDFASVGTAQMGQRLSVIAVNAAFVTEVLLMVDFTPRSDNLSLLGVS